MKPFVHLHVHSQYSLLDGQASIKGLVDKAMADGMPGLALTDHGNMFGIKEFFNYLKKVNSQLPEGATPFKGIFGCEMYVATGSRLSRDDKNDHGRHLIVLAKNKTGYNNLIKLVSQSWTEGFYMHPRTDLESLERYSEGLIVCSACLGGQLPKLIMAGRIKEAEEHAAWFKRVFGEDYYIELQRHKTDKPGAPHDVFEAQQRVNPVLIEIARKLDIKLVATNDVHFTNEEDGDAHDRLICISTNANYTSPDRMRYTRQEWLKSTQEMYDIFGDLPEALENTLEILDKVESYSIDHAPIMPFYEIPEEFGTEEGYRQTITEQQLFDEFTQDENGNVVLSEADAKKKIQKLGGIDKLYRIKLEADYLAKLAYEGAKRRYGDPLTPQLQERIKFELYIMKTMGFPGYFLIVQDFINAARNQLGVSVGPGRGSAAGSCVAYCLGITQMDPVKYDLLFERFLNPDRISLPDIDVDFDDDGREEVLHYVTEKYGAEKVAHIITYGTMASKMAIKDVARIEQLSIAESNRLAKMVPDRMPEVDGKQLKCNLDNCYKYIPDFKTELQSNNPIVVETLDYARRLEGNVRGIGVHACGVIICRDDISDWVPVATVIDKSSKNNERMVVTQYEGSVIEDTGLIKMDFLGLKTLSIIKEALKNIKLTRGLDIDIDSIDISDPKTYKLYSEGRTVGTFQFESAGMQRYLRELQPTTFEDLIAMNALYRPGPMDYIPDFIARKHGREPIVYDIPEMETYLKDTYGVTVYQEQVMLLSRLLANFTRGQSDTLRKAMGKKLKSKMEELKELFMEGGAKNGHKAETLEKIWHDWEKFASYAFNKSHATCYSWVAYQTAWLKANYPSEYMAAVLTRNFDNKTKLVTFMSECKKMHIQVKGPDINESFAKFGVNARGDIRFGLAAISGVGEGVVEKIVEERLSRGPYADIYDFIERVPQGILNRKLIESLAMAGAFDSLPDIKREDFFMPHSKGDTFTEALLNYGAAFHKDKIETSFSLFGDDAALSATTGRPAVFPAKPWPNTERLDKERELVGMYLSAHPLDPFSLEIKYGTSMSLKEFDEVAGKEGQQLRLAGLVTGLQEKMSRKGTPYGVLTIEDFDGTYNFMLFGKDYINFRNYGIPGLPVIITGRYERRRPEDDLRFNIKNIERLEDVQGKLVSQVIIDLNTDTMNDATSGIVAGALDEKATGRLSFRIPVPEYNRTVQLFSGKTIRITTEFLEALETEEIPFKVS